jgi:MFS family permease
VPQFVKRGGQVIQRSMVTEGLQWTVPQVADTINPQSPAYNANMPAISPFNYPLNLSASKLAPALITGNVVGGFLGRFVAGLCAEAFGWRSAFLALALAVAGATALVRRVRVVV